jgi:phage replication O-like protein O
MIAKPNYTQVPNEILDNRLSKMSCAEIKVFLTICRKTIGWHKDTDAVSYTQLMESTGLARAAVATAIKELEKKELIKVDRFYKRTSLYTIWFDNQTTLQESGLITEPEKQESGLKSEHTKDIFVKETTDKENHFSTSAKDVFFKTWNECFLSENGFEYIWTSADWAQYARYKIDSIPQADIVPMIKAWFSVPVNEVKFYPREIKSFLPKLSKAKALTKSTKSSKDDFSKVSGWEGK